jgi:regulator of replication initiation timing
MKHVFNGGRYGVAFEVVVGGKERKVEFDRKRLFLDTGNIATSGITSIDDDVYEALKKDNKRFQKMIKSGELKLVDEKALKGTAEEASALAEENKQLKKQLAEANKQSTPKEVKKQLDDKDNEIKNLKAQLEALTKGKDSETEGF